MIGASTDPAKLGYRLAHNLVESGYRGGTYFVNPKGGSLLGHEMFRTIADIPDPVDLAVLLIPASIVPQTLRDCGERGIRAVIISSGGFKETGAEEPFWSWNACELPASMACVYSAQIAWA